MASKKKTRTKLLRVAAGLDMPLDAVTQKIAWLGRTGSGKTFGCKRMVEQMLRAGAQVVVLDGSGGWAGLRLGPKAFDIPVLGGLYGDIPLEPTAGELVADVIVDRGTSIVLDVSQMLDAERTRFATAFGRRFFQRKKASPGAVHLVLEECQDFVPENCQRGEEQMLHEFQRLAKQGRPHGVGISFISQRPQEISKKALNQAECVFAFQMNGPHERKALQYWLTDKGFEGKLADVLPTLDIGAPYVWSPQWLKISEIVRILPIDSLDTSQTPKVGAKGAKSKRALKPIDLKTLNAAMAELIERKKAEDPKELMRLLKTNQARVCELEKELSKRNDRALVGKFQAAMPLIKGAVQLGQFDVVVDQRHLEETIAASEEFEADMATFEKTISRSTQSLEKARRKVNGVIATIRRARSTGSGALSKRLAKAPSPPPPTVKGQARNSTEGGRAPQPPGATFDERHEYPHKAPRSIEPNGHGGVSPAVGGGLRRMMIALAQRPGLTNRQIGVRAGLSSSSGTFRTYLSRACMEGWIVKDGDRRSLTPMGSFALGAWDPLPHGPELLDYWVRELGGGAARMLSALAAAYPNALTPEELGQASEIGHENGTFRTYLSRMRTLELIEGRKELRASGEFFE